MKYCWDLELHSLPKAENVNLFFYILFIMSSQQYNFGGTICLQNVVYVVCVFRMPDLACMYKLFGRIVSEGHKTIGEAVSK